MRPSPFLWVGSDSSQSRGSGLCSRHLYLLPNSLPCQVSEELCWHGFSLREDSGPFRVGLRVSGWTDVYLTTGKGASRELSSTSLPFNPLRPFHTHQPPLPNAKHNRFTVSRVVCFIKTKLLAGPVGGGGCNQVYFLPPKFFKMFLETIAFLKKLFSTYKIFI